MKRIYNAIAFAMSLLLLMLSLSGTVFAEDYVNWVFSDDGKTLSDGDKVYEYFEVEMELDTGRLSDTYIYANDAVYESYIGEESFTVYSTEKGGDIIWLEDEYYYDTKIYATEKGKEILDNFVNGKSIKYRLWSGYYTGNDVDEDTVKQLQKAYKLGTDSVNVSVRELSEWDVFDLTIHDEALVFSYTVGAVYEDVYGELYYIDYLSLGNQYFDAYGNFSYRNGYVDIAKLPVDVAKAVSEVLDGMQEKDFNYSWEDEGYYYSEEISLQPLFYIALILLGYVFPLPFLVAGLILPNIKKLGKPKYWYIMSAGSAVWIVCAVALTVIVLI